MASEQSNIGVHSELRVMTALLANGYEVSKPIVPEPYDLTVRDPRDGRHFRVQVKTAHIREDRGGSIVVTAKKRNGASYTLDECDYIVGVTKDAVYMIENTEQTEYWAMPDLVDAKWRRLGVDFVRNKARSWRKNGEIKRCGFDGGSNRVQRCEIREGRG